VIIGLHGKMGAGKNECARRLAFLSDQTVVEVSFAAKLKQSAAALLEITVDDLERWKNDPRVLVELNSYYPSAAPQRAITIRSLLQRYGTEAHRDVFGADFWLDAALPLDGIAGLYDPEYAMALYVVTDVRFPNEAQRVRDLGGVVVKVVGTDTDTGSHVSEQQLECDHTIRNVVRDDSFISLDERLGYLLRIVGDSAYDQLAA
jgi:hypothetical protein